MGAQLVTPSGEQSVRARIVVGADGRHSFVANAVAAPTEEEPPHRALYYCYARGFPSPNGGGPDGPEFSIVDDEMAYLFPSDNGLTCVALSINLAIFSWIKQALKVRFRERIAAHRGIATRFKHAVTESTIFGQGPERSYVRVPVGPGWTLVGDAGLHQDPWTGLGMDMASMHATFLGEAIREWFDGGMGETEALALYHQRRNEHGLGAYRQTVTLARDLSQLAQG